MKRDEIIDSLAQLGLILRAIGKGENVYNPEMGCGEELFNQLVDLSKSVERYNNWFTPESVRQSFRGMGGWLTTEQLTEWTNPYEFTNKPKRVAIIMAGNLPLVGFHDILSVLVSGNIALCKLSSDDKHLLPAIVSVLNAINSSFNSRIEIVHGKMNEIEAVIATGSNNSQNYFEQYFGKYPHIFRANRTSVAVLNGDETEADYMELGKDIFTYFGLGCRNVSHLLVPEGFDFSKFFEGIFPYGDIINHYKYGNNYDYNRAVHLLNLINLLDNNFLLVRETEELHSPLAMLFYHTYNSKAEIDQYLESKKGEIQVVIGKGYFPFGKAQTPDLTDYADNFNTLEWLSNI